MVFHAEREKNFHKDICQRHGLTPIVPIATSDMIGEYVNDDHTTVAEEMSHWDYVLYLAEQEGFVSRIKGKEWYFGPLSMMEIFFSQKIKKTVPIFHIRVFPAFPLGMAMSKHS